MFDRLRYQDARLTLNHQLIQENYEKYPTCSAGAAWRVSYTGSLVGLKVGTYRSMRDIVTPRFAKLSKAGHIVMNPMTKVERFAGSGGGSWPVVQATTVSCSTQGPYYWGQRWSSGAGGMAKALSGWEVIPNADGMVSPLSGCMPMGSIDSCITEASTAALNCRGRADSNLFETLAEVHKTAGLLNGVLGNALKVVARKGDLLRRAKDAGSAWLAYRYGLKPIMMDVETVVKGLAKDIGRIRKTCRGAASRQSVKTTTSTYVGTPFRTDYTVQVIDTVAVRAMSLDEYSASMLSNVGFTSKGLLTLPWEVLPYSFVADWFANIGDLIGAIVPAFGLTQLGSCYVMEQRIDHLLEIGTTVPASGFTIISPASGSDMQYSVLRRRVPGALVPGFAIRGDFRFDHLIRASDAIALLVQKLR